MGKFLTNKIVSAYNCNFARKLFTTGFLATNFAFLTKVFFKFKFSTILQQPKKFLRGEEGKVEKGQRLSCIN